jgi:hypothetical protein
MDRRLSPFTPDYFVAMILPLIEGQYICQGRAAQDQPLASFLRDFICAANSDALA